MKKKRKTTKTTAQLITAAIVESGLSQAEVARQVGCGSSTVSAWCAGLQKPSGEHLYWLGSVLGRKSEQLIGR